MIDFAVLEVSGQDALPFLQGQLTCDMREVGEKKRYGALCNTKGRVIASFEIQRADTAFLLYLPRSMLPVILKTLEKYAQFSQVRLEETKITPPPLNLLSAIRRQTAVILPETSEIFTPHELNYHQLGFISFTKGCYRGQEIIARMQYLGKLKKVLRHICLDSDTSFSPCGRRCPAGADEELVNIAQADNTHYEALIVASTSAEAII